ncbi:hypothetical protein J6590_019335 [Homalodisca vitripennis]|nr:hypothetical protein J6590_019335 [Homalodisca vitripennis]
MHFQIEHLQTATTRLVAALVLITVINLYIFINYPTQKRPLSNINRPLWSQDINFETANIKNDTGTPDGCYLVPNHIHFIRFGNPRFTYPEMICVLAALKNQKPDKITFHHNFNGSFTGPYWRVLSKLKAFTDIVEFNYEEEPKEIFGQPIDPALRKFHGSDITRIRILMKYGGIFLDNDCYVIKNLNSFRKYEMTLNWDQDQYLGTQVLLAHKDARFLKMWLDSYRGAYRGDLWYYNAGERPTTEILWRRPELIHRVKVQFGVDTHWIEQVFQESWTGWRRLHALHLLIHHQYLLANLTAKATFPVQFNQHNIAYYPITFREMAYDVYETGNIPWPKEYKD